MTTSDILLLAGGGVGVFVSLVHHVAMSRFVLQPINESLEQSARMKVSARKLVAPLMHYSTFAWFLGGLAVMAVALTMPSEAQRPVGLLVGASYLYAGIANMWATQGKHPGGWLMVLAVGLIGFGIA